MTDRISILIIEGEPNLRGELHSTLTGAEYTVLEVAEWTPKLAEFKPDIAIVDEILPSENGKDVCSQLHNSFGIPVILLGKDSSGEAWMRAVEAGADFYFTKPASHQEVVARVKAILRRYKKAAA